MQSMCVLAIPQFHVLTSLVGLINFILQMENYSEQQLPLTFGILQFLISMIILGLAFARPRYAINKAYIICLIFLFLGISLYLNIANFRKDSLILMILQYLSIGMICSLMILPNKMIGLVIQIQIYIVAVVLDLMSFYLYYILGNFNFNRAISIVGSGGMEAITLILCIVCQVYPQKRLADEAHLIVGFYIFCELFVSCTFVAECANQEANIALIGFTILKISNIFLDLILYSFLKLNYPENQTRSARVDIENPPQKLDLRSVATRETLSEYSNALQKSVQEPIPHTRKACPSVQWIQYLLNIY
ncbi:unnamed protein product [Paramecium octaurelia]|uniref:Uncharacterized protein n=1 Tax=Paramecium octaurelia TaxID=43137 RepID=A0A8S1X044_PAROT|nr:unnamed protein product [Paramecium octaurelia]